MFLDDDNNDCGGRVRNDSIGVVVVAVLGATVYSLECNFAMKWNGRKNRKELNHYSFRWYG